MMKADEVDAERIAAMWEAMSPRERFLMRVEMLKAAEGVLQPAETPFLEMARNRARNP